MSLPQSLVPGPPRPPHDPTFRLLNQRVGWGPTADFDLGKVRVDQSGALSLDLQVDPAMIATDPSLGGLCLPPNVAIGPEGTIYLLDPRKAQLKRFRPCHCRFEPVPCLEGVGSETHQLLRPRAILISCGKIYFCDTGNRRVSVRAYPSLSMRDSLMPPPGETELPWTPISVVPEPETGHLLVADSANGLLHRFHRSSDEWLSVAARNLGQVRTVRSTLHGRILVLTGDGRMSEIEADGNLQPIDFSFGALQDAFPVLPFPIDRSGNLDLRQLCVDSCLEPGGIFDRFGCPVSDAAFSGWEHAFPLEGRFISDAQDSQIHRCQWHRITLAGQFPDGTMVRVSTWTNEMLRSTDFVADLDEREWETRQLAEGSLGAEWDCLVRSDPGRYFWLKLELLGNGSQTPRVSQVRLEFPRISLRRHMPAVYGEDRVAADFTDRFLSLFDSTIRSIEGTLDQQAGLFDPMSAPAGSTDSREPDFLSFLGSWIGVSVGTHLPETVRRALIKNATRLFHFRGTRQGLWEQLLIHLGLRSEQICCPHDKPRETCLPPPKSCLPDQPAACYWQPPPLILEHFQLRRWLFLGCGRLGEQAVLWGQRIINRSQLDMTARAGSTQILTVPDPLRDPFHYYAHKFSVFVPQRLVDCERHRKGLELMIENEKPAHTHYQLVPVSPRFRIGIQSMIGLDSVIGTPCLPDSVLRESRLGEATLLQDPNPKTRIGGSLRVGSARLG